MSTPTHRIIAAEDPVAVGLEGSYVATKHDGDLVWHQIEVEGRGSFWASKIERLHIPAIAPNYYRYARPSRDRF